MSDGPLLNDVTRAFAEAHRNEDVRDLALKTKRTADLDLPAALDQIAGWQIARNKLPQWAACADIVYPAHISMEQCSSQFTAQYKAEIARRLLRSLPQSAGQTANDVTMTDLTGGFGVDFSYLARGFGHATYVERQSHLCELAAHNMAALGLMQAQVVCGDGVEYLRAMEPAQLIYIDPARRDEHGARTYAIEDCTPDVLALRDLLLAKARYVMIKLSPMLDWRKAVDDFAGTVAEVHIVSTGNECKELLLLLGQGEGVPADDIPIHCVNFTGVPAPQALVFTRRQEKERACPYTPQLKSYLYEPNASVLKAGAFRSLSSLYKVEKLHPNSHLYTSDHFLPDFPGRKFRITSSCGFGKKEVKEMLAAEKKANLTVRNFPATVAELRKRLKLAEGGGTYLFATTLADEKKVLIRCQATG